MTKITDDDIKKLKTVFATKDDLNKFATKKDMQKITKELKRMNGNLETTIKFFDSSRVNHEHRLKRIETKLNLPSFSD